MYLYMTGRWLQVRDCDTHQTSAAIVTWRLFFEESLNPLCYIVLLFDSSLPTAVESTQAHVLIILKASIVGA